MSALFVQFAGQQQFLGQPTPIPGLTLTLPEGSGESALVTLNVPASYAIIASWTGGQGGQFNISVDGTMLPAYAAYNYVVSMSSSTFPVRVPVTLVVSIPLKLKLQKVVALAANCIIDSTASLSAIL